jgi:hypothetical protein
MRRAGVNGHFLNAETLKEEHGQCSKRTIEGLDKEGDYTSMVPDAPSPSSLDSDKRQFFSCMLF